MVRGTFLSMGLAWLPVFCFALAVATFVISYTIAQTKDLVITPLPFISDTGAEPPASCWFGLFLNGVAYSFVLLTIVRYLQVKEHMPDYGKKPKYVNIAAVVLALIGSLGMSMVACFQETTVLSMHLTGAFMAFICATLYAFLQSYLTYALIKRSFFTNKVLLGLRILISCICLVTLFTATVPLRHAGYSLPPYQQGDEAYDNAGIYYLCTVSEWTLAGSFFLYVLSFCYEFSTIELATVVNTVRHDYITTRDSAQPEQYN